MNKKDANKIMFETSEYNKIPLKIMTYNPEKLISEFYAQSLINYVKTGKIFFDYEIKNEIFLNEEGTKYLKTLGNGLIKSKPKITEIKGEHIQANLNPYKVQEFLDEFYKLSKEQKRKTNEHFIEKLNYDEKTKGYTATLTKKGEEAILKLIDLTNNKLEEKIYQKNEEIKLTSSHTLKGGDS
ncbi:hypothetical protein K9M18_05160, partial [Candidatus Woesearchaeota archaeon]|nr:hypothetical protein [Candidatus Woesearchaeota archaeon]